MEAGKNDSIVDGLNVSLKHERSQCCLISAPETSDLDSRDENGVTSLMRATQNNHVDCVRNLASFGADTNKQDKYGKTALMYAMRHDNCDIFRILLDNKADINIQDNTGMNALMLSCQMGRVNFCEMLIYKKCNVNTQDNEGKTALIHTVLFQVAPLAKTKTICSLLCANNVYVNISDTNGMTALMYAAKYMPELCDVLVTQGQAKLNIRDTEGKTALMMAASMFHVKACQIMLVNNSDVNIKDNNNKTALTHALYQLVNYPAVPNHKITDAFNTLEHLINHGAHISFNYDLYSLLDRESCLKCGLTVRNLIRNGYSGIARLLISNGIMDSEFDHPYPLNRKIQTVVEYAATYGSLDLLKYVLVKNYLTQNDLSYIRLAASNTQWHNIIPESRLVLEDAASHVWSLTKLALVSVTTALGSGSGRWERINSLQLPEEIERKLMFQE